MPHIVADAAIPFLAELIGKKATLTLLPGRAIQHADLAHADALLVRTVTKVNAALLNDTPVRFVGSATAGEDHLDLHNVKHPVQVATASGANANAVAEYVLTVIAALQLDGHLPTYGLRIGIVGLGHVGTRVAQLLKTVGISIVCNDPLRYATEKDFPHTPLDAFCDLDVMTMHTPLTHQGEHNTYHLVNEHLLAKQKPHCVLINTSRGEVVDTQSVLQNPKRIFCLDVWENEPNINLELVKRAYIASPHIAGYTQEAKYAASLKIYAALCDFFGWPKEHNAVTLAALPLTLPRHSSWQNVLQAVYNPGVATAAFKESLQQHADDVGQHFEALRRNYPLRREFSAYQFDMGLLDAPTRDICVELFGG